MCTSESFFAAARSLRCVAIPLAFAAILSAPVTISAQPLLTWQAGALNGSMANAANWWNGSASQVPPGSDILSFDNDVQLVLQNNLSGLSTNRHRLQFLPGSGSRTIYGSTWNTFVPHTGLNPRIVNSSDHLQTISFPIALNAVLELHPTGGDLLFQTNIALGTSHLRIFGADRTRVTFGTNAIISGAGTVALNQGSVLTFDGRMHAYTGDTLINYGLLEITSGGPTNSSYIQLGATTGSDPAAVVIGPGASVASRITVRSGSSGIKTLGASGSSGTASMSHFLSLLAPLLITNAPGNLLRFTSPVVVGGQTLTISNAGSIAISNTLLGSPTGLLVKAGSGLLTLGGNIKNEGIGADVREGTLLLAKAPGDFSWAIAAPMTIAGTVILGGSTGDQIASVPITFTNGTLDLAGFSEGVGSIHGNGLVTNSGPGLATFSVGMDNGSSTFSGRIAEGPGAARITFRKLGSGTFHLAGSNSWSGGTALNGGKLIVTPACLTAGAWSLESSTTLSVRAMRNDVLNLSSLSINASSAALELVVNSWDEHTAAPINVVGSLTLPPSAFTIHVAGGAFRVGQFPLVRYGSRSSSTLAATLGSLPPGVSALLVDNPANKTIDLNITAVSPLTWTGAQNSNWDAAASNWKEATMPRVYSETGAGGRMVRFDDSAPGSASIALNTNVSPIAIVVSNSAKPYSFRGPGKITGSASVTKLAPGRLTLLATLTNDYTGKTVIHGGFLHIQSSSSLGSALTGTEVSGGTLEVSGGIAIAEPLTLAGEGAEAQAALHNVSGTNLFSGPINLAAAALVKASAGMLVCASPSQLNAGAATLGVGGQGTVVVSNGVSATRLSKTGTGTMILFGSNAVDTIVIEGGVLHLDGTNTGASGIDIAPPAMLLGNAGCAGAINVGGVLSPGTACANFASGSQSWNPGGALAVQLSDLTGEAGAGWDHLTINGGLDLSATGADPFTILLASLAGNIPGPCAGFNRDSAGQWRIGTVGNGITNFNPALLRVDPAAFSNDLAGGTFDLVEAGTELQLRFTPNRAPVASNLQCVRSAGMPYKIAISNLLAQATSDPDGDDCTLVSVGSTSAGGNVLQDATWIYYLPSVNDSDDTFQFTIRDLRPYRSNDTVRTATATITITTQRPGGSVQNIAMSGGQATIQFAGIPGYVYEVERSTNVVDWLMIHTIAAPIDGVFTFNDTNPPLPSAYYRLRQR